MTIKNTGYAGLLLAVLLGAAVLSSCSQSPQDKYKDATQDLKSAKQARNDAQQTLQKKQKALADARDDVKDAQNNLQQTQKEVAQAKQTVNRSVSDDVLFRTIQSELLNNDQFDNSAISVRVHNRVVTLAGTVPDQDTRKSAAQAVRSQPGVKKVINSLKINKSGQNQNASGSKKGKNSANGAGSGGQSGSGGGANNNKSG